MDSSEDSSVHVSGQTQKCCRYRYRIRWFNSKGAGLVLIWVLFQAATYISLYKMRGILFSAIRQEDKLKLFYPISLVLICITFLVAAPLSGWLADTRCGLYKVFKIGTVLVYIASVLACLCVLVLLNLPSNNSKHSSFVIGAIFVPLVYSIACAGISACFVTTLQLGLDQMPDASVENITSYIAWFLFCVFGGIWLSAVPFMVTPCTMYIKSSNDSSCQTFNQALSLIPVVCTTIVLCSDFLLAKTWLIIEPKSPHSLMVIFKVLKFAAKHKAPVNRSALTYWEEDIPSRIDLGKSRYGGPFTTEQVEDVKTIFKLLTLMLSFFIISLSVNIFEGIERKPHPEVDKAIILSIFTYNSGWWSAVGVLVYEFVIYPLAKKKLPAILTRIGVVSFAVCVQSLIFLVLSIVEHFYSNLDSSVWFDIVSEIISGSLSLAILMATFEFICAQSPYSMRGLVTGFVIMTFACSEVLHVVILVLFEKFCHIKYCSIIRYSLMVVLCVSGLILHTLLSHWYKRRVRDDIYSVHACVEEVYDRYLSLRDT